MPLYSKLRQYLFPRRLKETEPGEAYDQWSQNYDNQPGNLMLDLDEQVCSELLEQTQVRGKVIVDIGCGTGRHWKKITDKGPARLIGYDVSPGMLHMLLQKYPQAETQLLNDERLTDLGDGVCDLVLSTLTIAHIPRIEAALKEWYRVLRPGGEIIITDYHPEALSRGGKRTFHNGHKLVAVRNYIHPIHKINEIAVKLQMQVIRIQERKVDDSMRPYYEQKNAIPVFERFYGVPIIYGIHLKKTDAAE